MARPPWRVDGSDPTDTETVAEFSGSFEPRRSGTVYGPLQPEDRFKRSERSTTLRLRAFHDVIVMPHHVILSQATGAVLPVSFGLSPEHFWLRPSPRGKAFLDYQFANNLRPPKRIVEPVFLADAMFDGAFGHTLIEALPQLGLLSGAPEGTRVVTSASAFQPLFQAMGVEGERLLEFQSPLYCKTVYIPDAPVDISGNLHTLGRAVYARVGQLAGRSSLAPIDRVYLSRSRIAARKLLNELEIEALFRRYGFEIVHPELLSIPDQIQLVKNAHIVAGPAGSGMHHLLFAPPTTKALIFEPEHWFVELDQYISQADEQVGYALGRADPPRQSSHPRTWSWSIDTALIEHAIKKHFSL
ncbi:MAG: glycosyltransferase family 61 protein [Devosia sp.]